MYNWIDDEIVEIRLAVETIGLELEVTESAPLAQREIDSFESLFGRNLPGDYAQFLVQRAESATYRFSKERKPFSGISISLYPFQVGVSVYREYMSSLGPDIILFGGYGYDLGIRLSTGEIMDMFEWMEVVIAPSFEVWLRRCFADARNLRSEFVYWGAPSSALVEAKRSGAPPKPSV